MPRRTAAWPSNPGPLIVMPALSAVSRSALAVSTLPFTSLSELTSVSRPSTRKVTSFVPIFGRSGIRITAVVSARPSATSTG